MLVPGTLAMLMRLVKEARGIGCEIKYDTRTQVRKCEGRR